MITGGVSIIAYQLWRSAKRKRQFKIYQLLDDENEHVVEKEVDSLEAALEKLTSPFTSQHDEIKNKLEDAGIENANVAKYYMHIKYGISLVGIGALYLMSQFGLIDSGKMISFMAIWFVSCIIAPDSILAARKKSRQQRIASQLPYLLDLMAICVQTGMTLEAAMKYLAIELKAFDKELAKLLARVNDRAKIVGLEQALDELYQKLPTPEIRSFVMTLKQSLQYGSSIYSVLTTLAADIRDVNMLTSEEKIGKLAAKMSMPLILFIMMPIVIIILAPAMMRLMDGI
ncbi:type II secretion system F family protein [Vibrio aquaticus]|uniref:Type II secretion system F family protein n=2 Tax=Vibrio aquaticus TaxID=2496559 RepID=A0A3S0Q1M9_9VIBR|nr:type II secretion system F family protein [Vibrio aquaticus]